jgi:tetratricopeptide (TPR) repeat protein
MIGRKPKRNYHYVSRLMWIELVSNGSREYYPWEITMTKAELLHVIGRWEEAEEKYRINLMWACKSGLDEYIARTEAGLGDILQAKGNFDEAVSHLENAYQKFEKVRDLENMSYVKGKTGTIQWKKGNYNEALELYQIQRNMAEKAGDLLNLSRALGNLGSIYADLADNDNAIKFYLDALELTKRVGYRRNIAITLCNIGTIHWSQNELEKALGCYRQAMTICQEVGDKRTLGMIYGNLGTLYNSMDDNRMALECQKNKIIIMDNLGDRPGKCSALDNAADILIQEKEYDLAERYLDEAVALASELQIEYHLCEYICLLAELYSLTGRNELCSQMAKRAMDIAVRTGREDVIFKSRLLQISSAKDKNQRLKEYSAMLDIEKDEYQLAELYYLLYKETGQQEDRKNSRMLFEKLNKETPKKLFRNRITELCQK